MTGTAVSTDPAPYDPAEGVGKGRTVIEASAGTGKTFTIAAAVTRLVALDGVPLEQILVVTFTRAATAELRSRVRRRMVETMETLRHPGMHPVDDHMRALHQAAAADPVAVTGRLEEALTRFDRAQIFTIHGFAQRLLGALGLRSRLRDDLEPDAVDDLLLAQVSGDLVVARFVDAPDAAVIKPATVAAMGRLVVETPDARIVPDPSQAGDGPLPGHVVDRVAMAHAMRTEIRRRMDAAGVATYDDGLLEVRAAVSDPEIGDAARSLLRRRYAVALVDESQDTDPVQWDVIRSVFDESRLVVIGDPKQSIYSFRGADIESYLAAVAGADRLRTLDVNWRSDGPLLTALDVLFEGAFFGDERIRYRKVAPPPERATSRIHGAGHPLSIRRFGENIEIKRAKDGFFYIGECRRAVAADTAAEVVRMLAAGITIDREDGVAVLGPGDIAVLCRTRKQVDLVRDELGRRAVPSVAARTGGVFASPAAEEWRRFLLAVEQPERVSLVRLAATTVLVGLAPAAVAALDDTGVLALQQQMREWKEMLDDTGVPALIERLGRVTDLVGRVLAGEDGERMMTDLVHIAEEMHAVWRRNRSVSLVRWLEATVSEAARRADRNIDEPDARQRRLETDAAAVQVQTVHGAKGLQYPVVLVPFAWDVPSIDPQFPVFHEAPSGKGAGADTPRRRVIDVGGVDSPDFADHVAAARAEDVAEESRLLYVALTRAEHRLVVWWVENCRSTAATKLHALLAGEGRSPEDLASRSGDTIAMAVVNELAPTDRYRPPPAPDHPLLAARFDRRLDHRWQRASFSSLSPEHPLGAGPETAEEPGAGDEPLVDEDVEPAAAGAELPMADLPRGARFGTLFHHVLEHVGFGVDDPAAAVHRLLDVEMAAAAWDFDADRFVAGVVATLETPLGPRPEDTRLRDIAPGMVLDEMRFELPVRTEGVPLSLADIGAVMLDHLPAGNPYRGYAADLVVPGRRPFRGYLTGAIDVTAALSGAEGVRYVVMDYKTNALPTPGAVAVPQDYGPGPLATAMIGGNYVLQATLYQVALHRYLQWRLPGYDPHRHLGGARYLFVRGMAGAATPVVDGERCGVARWHPPAEMVLALSELFAGVGE